MSSTRSSLQDGLIEKALKDPAFRERLNADPKGTIENEYGVKLPNDMDVHVHNESTKQLHVVLPHVSSGELSADEMSAADCSGWSSAASCAAECTQCSNNDTTCAPGPTEG